MGIKKGSIQNYGKEIISIEELKGKTIALDYQIISFMENENFDNFLFEFLNNGIKLILTEGSNNKFKEEKKRERENRKNSQEKQLIRNLESISLGTISTNGAAKIIKENQFEYFNDLFYIMQFNSEEVNCFLKKLVNTDNREEILIFLNDHKSIEFKKLYNNYVLLSEELSQIKKNIDYLKTEKIIIYSENKEEIISKEEIINKYQNEYPDKFIHLKDIENDSDEVLAWLYHQGYSDYIYSTDSDFIAFNCKYIYYINGILNMINPEKIMKTLNINLEKLQFLCILCGTDYNLSPEGIGPIAMIYYIQHYSEDEILIRMKENRLYKIRNNIELPINFPTSEETIKDLNLEFNYSFFHLKLIYSFPKINKS